MDGSRRMSASPFQIRTMAETEMPLVADWAAMEGWNPGLNDAQLFYSTDPQGFLAGYYDGFPIATISAIRYGKDFGFIGFYIVKPEFRGKGFGLRLWQAAMNRLSGRNIGLDGVVAQQENYKQSGFKPAYRNIRYQAPPADYSALESPNVVPLGSAPFDKLLAYDSTCFFTPRPVFVDRWIHQPNSQAFAYMTHDRLQGYGVVRQCGDGCKVGPLFADNPIIAHQLLTALATFANGQNLFLDVPEPNAAAISLAEQHSMSPVFYTARMYTGALPPMNLASVFGVTSFELG